MTTQTKTTKATKTTKELFLIEMTDMYGGEANYSWTTRHIIRAKSERGAINWLSRNSGLNWRYDGYKYLSTSKATCAFIEPYDKECHSEFLFLSTDQRKEGE